VDDDVDEVDEDPPPLALPLAAHRLDAQVAQDVLDLVDDRPHLSLGLGRDDDEDVGQRELLGDVDAGDGRRELAGGGGRRRPGQLERSVGCGHGAPRDGAWAAAAAGAAYRWCLEMYWTTPSGTRYQIGSAARTRSRQSVELIAMAGTSWRSTRSAGSPDSESS
jgi:hypothetical protein